jgi:hypothetical protein
MAVIVNEFEVLADAPSDAASGNQTSQAPPPAALATRPEDLRRILGHLELRLARVAAD